MVIRQMNAHAETCDSGDNTLRAAHKVTRLRCSGIRGPVFTIGFTDAQAIKHTIAVDTDADEHFVVRELRAFAFWQCAHL